MNISELKDQLNKSIRWAETLTKTAYKHKMVRHDGTFNCDFAGMLLATIIVYPIRLIRPGETNVCKIRICDADDWEIQAEYTSIEEAEKMFDILFKDSCIITRDQLWLYKDYFNLY